MYCSTNSNILIRYNLKKCKNCYISKECSEFIKNHEFCYKCTFRIKKGVGATLSTRKQPTEKRTHCGICEKPLPPTRWRYCSKLCLKESKRRNVHWSLKVQRDSKGAKYRFNAPLCRFRKLKPEFEAYL